MKRQWYKDANVTYYPHKIVINVPNSYTTKKIVIGKWLKDIKKRFRPTIKQIR